MRPKIAMALSGGGFRASIFHLGILRRIAELGWLPAVDVISTVSGGSIIGAFAALRWDEFVQAGGDSAAFESLIAEPFLSLVQSRSFLAEWLANSWKWPFRKLVSRSFTRTQAATEVLDDMFFAGRSCSDLPAKPMLIMNATNLHSIRAWRFTKWGMGDSRSGHTSWSDSSLSLSTCVGASAAFPPVFPPTRIEKGPYRFSAPLYGEEPLPDYPLILLTDGGVYDNAGLEVLIKPVTVPGLAEKVEPAEFLIVSDGGAPTTYRFTDSGIPAISDALLLYRVDAIARAQVSALRTRSLMREFLGGRRQGLLVGLSSSIQSLPAQQFSEYCKCIDQRFHIPDQLLKAIRGLRTSLDRFNQIETEALMYHAYSMTDAFLWGYRDSFSQAFQVEPQPSRKWMIEFTPEKIEQWRSQLERAAAPFS